MSVPRIFISHSSDASEHVRKLYNAFSAAGFDVLLDQVRLAGGDDWRNEIYTWIARAHGAVVVVSRGALESTWVKFELAALAPRRWLDPQFKLVPALLPPVTPEALQAKAFEPYDLAALQTEMIDPRGLDAYDKVVDVFRPLLVSFSDTPLDRLETTIARELPRDYDVLERTAQLLNPSYDNEENRGAPAAIARSLFHAAVEKIRDALAEIAAAHVTRSQLQKIVDIVVPFWVDPRAIIELAREAAAPYGPHRVLLLNSRHLYLGKLYAQRAALQYPLKWEIVPVTNAGGDDVVGSVVSELRDHFRSIDPMLDDASNEEIDADIERTASMDPIIVIVSGRPTASHLAKLRDRYPHCIFLAMCGPDLPDPVACANDRLTVLEPRIEEGRQEVIRTHYVACYRLVSNVTG